MGKISSISNKWLNRLYKMIAILLVLFAVALSGLRIFLPYAPHYRQAFQDYINENYQANILIGGISSGWEKFGPTLVAKNVSLVRSDLVNIFIDQIDFSIDFWGSLQAGQLITNDFTLKGAKVFLDKKSLQQDTNLGDNALVLQSLGDLFLQQVSRFSIKNSQLILQRTGYQPRTIFIDNLAWLNRDGRHQANGEIIFDGISTNNIQLKLDIAGNQINEISGQVYLAANNIDITPWLDQLLPVKPQQSKTAINFESWLTVADGKAQQLQVDLGENQVKWTLAGHQHQLAIGAGQLLLKPQENFDVFELYSTPLAIQFDDHQWQPINLQFSRQLNQANGYMSFANITDIVNLLSMLGVSQNSKDLLDKLAPSGEIQDVYFERNQQGIMLSSQFRQLSNRYANGIPAMFGVNGHVLWANNQFQILLDSKQGQLNFKQHFTAPIAYETLRATINGEVTAEHWSVFSDNLFLQSKQLTLAGQFALDQQQQAPMKMSLFAKASDINIANAKQLFPRQLMSEALIQYLEQSLYSGKIEQANVLFNGPLNQFPFTDKSGVFSVQAKLANAEFQFQPEWPAISHFDAILNFTNESMKITALKGDLSGLSVANVTANINDLMHQPLLYISADLQQAEPQNITKLIDASPLADKLGQTLHVLNVQQAVDASLALQIPLVDDQAVQVSGEINLANNQLHLQKPLMQLTNVSGKVKFHNDVITSEGLHFSWQKLPFFANVHTADKDEFFEAKIELDGRWTQQDYRQKLPEKMSKRIRGDLNWQGQLALYFPHAGAFSYQLDVSSNLTKSAFVLPKPFNKPLGQDLPLKIKVNGQTSQSTFNAKLGENLSFFGVLNHQSSHFERAHLLIGQEQMLLPMNGFHISANLPEADFADWQPFLSDLLDTLHQLPEDNNVPLFPKPKRIRGQIAKVTLAKKQLDNVDFNLLDQNNWWLLQLNAKQARGEIKFYPDWLKQGIAINADYIKLAAETPQTDDNTKVSDKNSKPEPVLTEVQINEQIKARNNALFQQIPPMVFHCDQCNYGVVDLGEVDFRLERKADTILLKHFKARRNKTELTFEGQWQHNVTNSHSQFSGTIKTKDVEHEIEKLGYASVVKDSGATLDFDVNWPHSPFDFKLANLNGDIHAGLNDGYLAEVSDKGARIFSVLSLQSLVRKLRLDFRDIFSDGMFYSKITGDFHLKNGVMYTDNTKMKGAAGDLSIKGNTKLVEGLLDYRMSYKPNLTSSLPVIAWIATLNPVTFLAGVALDEVITAKVVTEYNFELTGPVAEPNLKQVNSKTRNISVGRSTPPKFVDNDETGQQQLKVDPETKQTNEQQPKGKAHNG